MLPPTARGGVAGTFCEGRGADCRSGWSLPRSRPGAGRGTGPPRGVKLWDDAGSQVAQAGLPWALWPASFPWACISLGQLTGQAGSRPPGRL